MITIKSIPRTVEKHSCDNCDRETGLNIVYTFTGKSKKVFNKLTLCEDCACAMGRLFIKTVISEKSFKYYKDDITEVKE